MNIDLHQVDMSADGSSRMHRLGAEFDHKANILWLAGARESHGIAVHELMHFFEHCSTPYGYFQDEIYQRTLGFTIRFLREHEGPVFTPIFQWVRRYLNNPGMFPEIRDHVEFGNLVDTTIKPWSKYMHLWQVLEGLQSKHVIEAFVSELESLLLEIEGDTHGPSLAAGFGESACPPIQHKEAGAEIFQVGALHVSECLAQIQEGFAGITPKNVSVAYVILFLLATDYFNKASRVSGNRDRHIEMTCLAMADLALFIPAGKTYGHLRHVGLDWSAVHPGWRFYKALQLVAEEDWWIMSLFEAEGLADRICARLGWPLPRRFLEYGAQLTGRDSARHRYACEIRLRDFMAFYRRDRIVDSESAVFQFLSDHLPMVHYPGVGTVWNVSPADRENAVALQQLKRCFLARRCADAMMKPALERVLPQDCKFDMYFEGVSDEDDIARLVTRKSPWLDASRFVQLPAR